MEPALQYLTHSTYDDWLHWEGRWELIEGHPIAKNPLPEPKHQRVAGLLGVAFSLPLKNQKNRTCRVYNPIDYKIAEDTILQPDMLIVCGEIIKAFLDFPPRLVAEVLSDTTVLIDRNIKFEKYQQQGVKYYLMADIDEKSLELYELQEGGYVLSKYNYNEPVSFFLSNGCTIEVLLNELWD